MNEPEPRQHGNVSYRHPADIDGEPDEVRRASIAALADATAVAYEVANAAFNQARNAAMDSMGPELCGEAVLDWEAGFEGQALVKIVTRLDGLRRAARVLATRELEAAQGL